MSRARAVPGAVSAADWPDRPARAGGAPAHLEARVDLDAVGANVAVLRAVTSAEVMAVVKADAFGHGMVPVAAAAVRAGASWLGACRLEDALALRRAGFPQPIFAWLIGPGEPLVAAVRSEVDMSVSAGWLLDGLAAAAAGAGRTARVHLKLDTGMGRGGATAADWPALVAAAARWAATGLVDVVGVWTHFACADVPGHPETRRQLDRFRVGIRAVEAAGLRPRYRHAANSAALLTEPAADFDLVRPGLAVYGLSPLAEPADLIPPGDRAEPLAAGAARDAGGVAARLRPAMTLSGAVTQTGPGWAAVPGGLAAGLPSVPPGSPLAWLDGARLPVLGCRPDHLVLGTRGRTVPPGAQVVLFGPGDYGEPTVQDWAAAAATIPNDVLVRVGQAVPRRYTGEPTPDRYERTANEHARSRARATTTGTVHFGPAGRAAGTAVGVDSGTGRPRVPVPPAAGVRPVRR